MLAMLMFIFGSLADITASRRLFVVKNALSVCSAPLKILIRRVVVFVFLSELVSDRKKMHRRGNRESNPY